VDLNGLVEEALNLAYHGARAQDAGFNITLDIKLVFQDRSAGKPVFVFVHGTSCNRSFFAPQDDEARVAEPGEPRPRVTRISRPDTQSRGLAGHPIRVDPDRRICSVAPSGISSVWRRSP
jgi:hypothetical protein